MHHGNVDNDTVEGRIFRWLRDNPGWHSSLEIQNACNTVAASTFMSSIRTQLGISDRWTLEDGREGRHGIYRVVKAAGQMARMI